MNKVDMEKLPYGKKRWDKGVMENCFKYTVMMQYFFLRMEMNSLPLGTV